MISNVSTILFATNLKPECMEAFHFAAALATRFGATLVILHVMEQIPDYVEKRVITLLGKTEWKALADAKADTAREKLIGKQSSNALVQEALAHFCSNAGIDNDACRYQSREIVVTDGDVVETIVQVGKQYDCNLIVMGMKGGLLSQNTIGDVAKAVMRKSPIPVTVVPHKKA